ncbi:MAG: transporter substrate-binding domain-containing protein [Candidatus Cloacimonetes bacterium]|nr:transporter substrate-binding domain-containing protein [Candidatus Cloacimonadota bacterium]
MKTKRSFMIVFALLFLVSATLYGYETYTDLAGKAIGMESGTVWEQYITQNVKGNPVRVRSNAEGLAELRAGKIEGFMTDLSIVKDLANSNPDLKFLALPLSVFSCPMGAMGNQNNPAQMQKFNAFLKKIKADGTLADMQERWLNHAVNATTPMPTIANSGENGTLTVATAIASPFVYKTESGLKGYSIELMLRFGADQGQKIDFHEMEFKDLMPHVLKGNEGMAIANMSITPIRLEMTLMSDSIYDDGAGICVLK